jgi:formamidopyrimidine-DNA glycosylase
MNIIGVEILWDRTVAEPAISVFMDKVINQTIKDVERRGKFLILVLTDYYLLFHLRMSGDILIESWDEPHGKHHRVVLALDKGFKVAFVDPRKFGRVWLLTETSSVLGALGPEPLSDEFSPERFFQELNNHHRQIKPLLLDQKFLAGMGNIYTDEALHCARIHPLLKSDQITPQQSDRLWKCIRSVLQDGIKNNGASIDWVYRGGGYQNYFRVYQRGGEPCQVCGVAIERIVVGQRGTHFCPECQYLPMN